MSQVDFPYKFGNLYEAKSQKKKNIVSFGNVIPGFDQTYQNILKCVANGNMPGLKQICEQRLYSKISEQYTNLCSQGYKFQLENKRDNIEVEIDRFAIIVNGYIDRDKEIQQNLEIQKDKSIFERGFVIKYKKIRGWTPFLASMLRQYQDISQTQFD
eukprot:TRINITY_DN27369_c0_g1_i2.p1 TRINITY_DN27369_c0_g1~~TRINITY_DN27369_c0_g1_i2.p1  ORF type:complete len:157 (+),score=20.50 TRINITY_DN27369_c0_g1_i2:239-709(+)